MGVIAQEGDVVIVVIVIVAFIDVAVLVLVCVVVVVFVVVNSSSNNSLHFPLHHPYFLPCHSVTLSTSLYKLGEGEQIYSNVGKKKNENLP